MARTVVEAPVLEQLVRFAGTQDRPIEHIALEGFRFTQTASTFLAPYDVPSLSDWAVHRGGAVFLEGTQSCAVRRCLFDVVGGNAVFINDSNRTAQVSECKFTETGDSAVCLVGTLGVTNGSRRVDLEGWRALGFDKNSVFADPLFVDPSKNDYRVKPESSALKVGFKNFEMGAWGIQDHFPAALR